VRMSWIRKKVGYLSTIQLGQKSLGLQRGVYEIVME